MQFFLLVFRTSRYVHLNIYSCVATKFLGSLLLANLVNLMALIRYGLNII